ncbi:sigma-54 interaction domain-containing protein [Methylococcus geothermalis]|uniref:AAA domain-containing protein n=1 Tax=Methylococcus geothermalis TaxID=2681310 RepID=A0A858Q5M9_9GAMM|nr:sigma-54 dependent transcriptional regulator [Methylococcus geothermalis]QJD29162.1 AAA domain-containing protein [Methylococcus geothermalis]
MFEVLIGQSPGFEALIRSARLVAATDVTVLIVGETGTGKELLAQALQQCSLRAAKPFVTLNCAALPASVAESELFGHRRGAFTGAVSDFSGRLETADGGTLFLDEINSLPVPVQAKLLRFLDSGEIQPIGARSPQRVDVRIIAATNANLHDKIESGDFRRDLYYRLSVVPLEIPPLRDRGSDVELLLHHFMRHFAQAHGIPPAVFDRGAIRRLSAYPWPGNIRELRNFCERLAILMAGRVIEEKDLPEETLRSGARAMPLFTLPDEGFELERMEVDFIRQALQRTNGNRTRAAKLLGLTRDQLNYRIQKYGID